MDYNLVMYIGVGLIVFGFLGFIVCEMELAEADRKLFRQEQLTKSFNKGKQS